MSVAEVLELVGTLAVIVGAALMAAALVPPWMSWPIGLLLGGVLLLGFAWLIERAKGGGGE